MSKSFESESIDRLAEKIDETVEYFSKEYDIPFSAAVGILFMKAVMMVNDQQSDSEGETV